MNGFVKIKPFNWIRLTSQTNLVRAKRISLIFLEDFEKFTMQRIDREGLNEPQHESLVLALFLQHKSLPEPSHVKTNNFSLFISPPHSNSNKKRKKIILSTEFNFYFVRVERHKRNWKQLCKWTINILSDYTVCYALYRRGNDSSFIQEK